MSKETNSSNLRLLGSPVNLNNRSKRRDVNKNNIRNRPRSALQNPIFSDSYERYKRPYSAGDKDYQQSTRSFLHTFNVELKESKYNSTATPNNIKIVPPTTALLGDPRSLQYSKENNRDIASNASDYGSEDTYMSLGTKIKARAQSPKGKKLNNKNILKYKNPVKKDRKIMDNINQLRDDHSNDNVFGVEVKFMDRDNASSTNKGMLHERCSSPYICKQQFMSYYVPLESRSLNSQPVEDPLAGRVSFGSGAPKPDVANAIDSYSHRLLLTKQQLSLVEEESTQEVESPTQNGSSLSTEMSIEEAIHGDANKNSNGNRNGRKSALGETNTEESSRDFKSRTCSSFYKEFESKLDGFNSKMSDGTVHTDGGSKDSGYHDSDINRPSSMKYNSSRTNDVTREHYESENRPSSSKSNKEFNRNFLPDKHDYTSEGLNHSRLLYKDFFLRKEGHVAVAPLNSPISILNIPDTNETNDSKKDKTETELEYPSYLLHSTTKAYTSKVIEDYKKEIAAINNLHELTLKDIKTDTVSPTPLDLDKLFDVSFEDKPNQETASVKKENNDIVTNKPDTPVNRADTPTNRADIANVSTQELIQNYFKVKEGEYSKNIKKTGKNKLGYASGTTNIPKMVWKSSAKDPKASPSKIQGQKNIFTLKTPSSARIEGVQNDKDVESWMSLSDPSPRVLEEDQRNSAADNEIATTSKPLPNDDISQITPATEIVTTKPTEKTTAEIQEPNQSQDLNKKASVLDIYSMLKEIDSFGENPMKIETKPIEETNPKEEEKCQTPKDNFMEIFQFLEKVEQSANDALSVVTTTTPASIPKLELLLKLPQTELAQRLVTASLQLEERSCCIALLQESLTNHKEQMITKISNLEKQSTRTVSRVKSECEEAIKRHQAFIDQLINDKKTLNHRIEQLVEERRGMEERWRRSAAALEGRYKLQLTNHHEKMLAAQQVARQRWVRQKADKIKELTVKGLEGELREMAERQQKEVADLKMAHAETVGKMQGKHAQELDELRRAMEGEREAALVKERQMASARLEKHILELEATYHEQRTRLINEMRAESERVATELTQREQLQTRHIEQYKEEQEKLLEEKKAQLERDIAKQRENIEEQLNQKSLSLEREFEQYKRSYETEQQIVLNRRVKEIAAQHKVERDKEIERAIERLEAEAQAGRKEMQDAMRRNKEQYEAELQELGETEKATLRRYQEAQARVRQTEDKCAELEVAIGQFETRNKILTERNIQLEEQVSSIKSSCEAAWAQKLSEAKREMDEAKRVHDEQMHQLYAKVKVAVARKDSAIQALTRETSKYQEKVALLEQKLQQQRKDFLKHK